MESFKLEEVFGVSKEQVASYVVRTQVDEVFKAAMKSDRQIIIYGASKQGKTALVSKYLPYEDNVLISCSPKSTVVDIYKAILRKLGIEITGNRENVRKYTVGLEGEGKAKGKIPVVAECEAALSLNGGIENETNIIHIPVDFNLELPQDIFELYKQANTNKFIILENFHYLSELVQKQLAFDLRTFQELGMRFVILGVWREKNRLVQYNGDLLDRITEVPVEPWERLDFEKVIKTGEECLNILIDEEIIKQIIVDSFGSIGVLQELLRVFCLKSGITETQQRKTIIENQAILVESIKEKVNDYSSRHIRALEDIAKGNKASKNNKEKLPLYLPYYFVQAILTLDFDEIYKGIDRNDLEEAIKKSHHRKDSVRPSDITNLLDPLTRVQVGKGITPPIFDYDRTQRMVKVIDSTFYFFLKNANTRIIAEEIPNPLDRD